MREGRREDGGGEGEVGEERRKNVRFMELGKLKVIKSEDYSTAKLLKFLREVVGFRPLACIHYSQLPLFCRLLSLRLHSFFLCLLPGSSSVSSHTPKFLFKGASRSFPLSIHSNETGEDAVTERGG